VSAEGVLESGGVCTLEAYLVKRGMPAEGVLGSWIRWGVSAEGVLGTGRVHLLPAEG